MRRPQVGIIPNHVISLWAKRLICLVFFAFPFATVLVMTLVFAEYFARPEEEKGVVVMNSCFAALSALSALSFTMAQSFGEGNELVRRRRTIRAGAYLAMAAVLVLNLAVIYFVLRTPAARSPFAGSRWMSFVTNYGLGFGVQSYLALAALITSVGVFHLCAALASVIVGFEDVPLGPKVWGRRLFRGR